jgi:hypothetical protein
MASRGVVMLNDMATLFMAVVWEPVDGHADERPAPTAEEAEDQYEHNQLDDEFFDNAADPLALLFGILRLVFGFREFDVFHVVVVVGGRGGDEVVILLVDGGAGDFVDSHDVKSIEACKLVDGQGRAMDPREREAHRSYTC